jgi:hypothetical protein
LTELLARKQTERQHFYPNRTIEAELPRAINHANATGGDALDQLVVFQVAGRVNQFHAVTLEIEYPSLGR